MTNKDYKMMDQGMLLAVDKFLQYEKNGLNPTEELVKELKRRGVTKIPWCYTDEQKDKLLEELSRNLYNSMISVFFMTLEEGVHYQNELVCFDGDMLRELKDKFDKNVDSIMELDYIGEHYVSLQDFVAELNDKYGFAFEYERVATCQQYQDVADERFHYAKIETIIESLKKNGFDGAADFLSQKIERTA